MNKPYHTSRRMLFIWLLVASVVLLLIPHGVTGKLQGAVTRLFRVPLRMGRMASLAARAPLSRDSINSAAYQRLALENRELTNHAANLSAQLDALKLDIQRQSQLRMTTGWRRTIFLSADAFHSLGADRLLINRGAEDSVRVGQYVLAANAVVGSIIEVQNRQARVALISDRESRIPVFIKAETTLGMLTGMGEGGLKVTNIRKEVPVEPGDRVYAMKLPGRLESPVVVGVVREVGIDKLHPLLLDIEVTPSAELSALFSVSVIECGQSS